MVLLQKPPKTFPSCRAFTQINPHSATGDGDFLTGDGLALASSVADFLVSRVRMDDEERAVEDDPFDL